jgi:inner membrane protein
MYYAKAKDLHEYLNLTAIRGEVVVQFWLRPGDAVVELSFGGSGKEVTVPDVLGGMF